jgi:hypothetical protein
MLEVCHLLQQLKAAKLPFRELDLLVKAMGELDLLVKAMGECRCGCVSWLF